MLVSSGEIPILYDGGSYIVVDKPSGVLTHPHHIDKESPILIELLRERLGWQPLTVHRLDRMTTGAIVLTRDKETAAKLADQFAAHEVQKRYLAITRGHMDAEGTMDEPLPHRSKDEVLEAETRYRCLAHGVVDDPIGRYDEGWFSLVMLELLTGRTHQARRHLHRSTHPVLGDKRHGDNDYNRWARPIFGQYMFLRAYELSFFSPDRTERITVTSGLDEKWQQAVGQLFSGTPENYSLRVSCTVSSANSSAG
jgi:tRNA pseudouridine65 synthase